MQVCDVKNERKFYPTTFITLNREKNKKINKWTIKKKMSLHSYNTIYIFLYFFFSWSWRIWKWKDLQQQSEFQRTRTFVSFMRFFTIILVLKIQYRSGEFISWNKNQIKIYQLTYDLPCVYIVFSKKKEEEEKNKRKERST